MSVQSFATSVRAFRPGYVSPACATSVVTVTSTTTSADLAARYRRVLPSFLAPYYAEPIAIDHGEGSYVYDLAGERYLDFFGGVLTTMIGHHHPAVTAAVQEQAAKVMHTSTLYLSEPMIEFAEMVAEVSGIPDARVYFTPSGSEANDAALLFATSYRKSNQILAIRNSYHGRVFSTQAITSHSSWRSTSHSGLQVQFVHGGYRLRSPFRDLDDDAYTEACVDDLVQVLDMTSAGDVAAMIAEPIQGVGGLRDTAGRAVRRASARSSRIAASSSSPTRCRPGGAEPATTSGGTRPMGSCPTCSRSPKGVGNGITLAGVVARAEIMDTIEVLQLLDVRRQPAVGGSRSRHAANGPRREPPGQRQGDGGAVRGRDEAGRRRRRPGSPRCAAEGLMWAFEVCEPGTIEPDKARTGEFHEACRRHGLLVGKGGLYGNVVRLAPMLNVTRRRARRGHRRPAGSDRRRRLIMRMSAVER